MNKLSEYEDKTGLIVSLALIAGAIYMLFFRKYREAEKLERDVSVSR